MKFDVKVQMEPGWQEKLTQEITRSPEWARIQRQANEAAQEVVREVNERMKGGDAELIVAELAEGIKRLGARPNLGSLRPYAQEIANGTLK